MHNRLCLYIFFFKSYRSVYNQRKVDDVEIKFKEPQWLIEVFIVFLIFFSIYEDLIPEASLIASAYACSSVMNFSMASNILL